jgi:hypothetical protein
MIRFATVISLLAFTAFAASAAPENAVVTPQKAEAAQVYQALQVQDVEQAMLYDDNLITYGYAVVSCGLRTPQWFQLLRGVYAHEYAAELQIVPLNTEQQAQALSYANAHVQNPSPPPYICGRLQQDSTLAALDRAVALRAFEVAAAK